jgi:tetratricopeptide (TPR) repeat protein
LRFILKKTLIYIGISFLILNVSGCFSDPNETANELYIKALQSEDEMKKESKSYSDALRLYNNTLAKLQLILSEHSSSNIAVSLATGELLISGMTLKEFQQLESPLRELAEAESRPLSYALFVAKNMSRREWTKPSVLSEIAGVYAEAGHSEKAALILLEAYEATRNVNNIYDRFTPILIYEISIMHAEIGLFSKALDMAMLIDNEMTKSIALAKIAEKTFKAGNSGRATQLLQRSVEIAKTLEEGSRKVSALTQIAEIYIVIGQPEVANELLLQALRIVSSITTAKFKDEALVHVTDTYTEIGQPVKALETAEKIENQYTKANVISKIAGQYAESDEFDLAFKLMKVIRYKSIRSDLLTNIADKYQRTGRTNEAKELLLNALETTLTIENEVGKSRSLIKIAGVYAQIGETDEANRLLTLALVTAEKIESSIYKDSEISDIAIVYAELGQLTDAIETLETINDNNQGTHTRALVKIAGKFNYEENLNKQNLTKLRESVQLNYPLKDFWSIAW